ncbi:MAG TPA: thioredoxin domain-containing protein [Gemmatirosa sp.]
MFTPAAPSRATRRRAVPARLAVALAATIAGALACRGASDGKAVATANAATVTDTRAAGASDGRPGADSVALRAAADSGRIQGSPGAKVWLIEVSDFQCPYCKMWHDESYDALRREYIAAGKARAAYVNFPLDMHVQAMPAAEAAMCASAQHRFWEFHSALFRTQDRWGHPGDPSATFDSLATATGVDVLKFRACTRSHVMRALVEADRDRMERAGVRSTPTFYVGNKQIAGAQPTDVFRQALDAAVANPPALPSGGR